MRNGTAITEFILLGFPGIQGSEALLFIVIFLIYILTLSGNGLIIVIVWVEPRLQTPMYFFLCNLAFLEIWYTTTVIPKLLETFVVSKTVICTACCLLQKEASLAKVRAALIHEYKHKYLEDSLTTWPLSKTTIIGC